MVGLDIHGGERVQWLVEGGKYKASFLMPDEHGGSESEGLLISEVSNFLSPPTPLVVDAASYCRASDCSSGL